MIPSPALNINFLNLSINPDKNSNHISIKVLIKDVAPANWA